MSSQPHQVGGDARQFRQQHADVLRALGYFQTKQFFNGEAVAQIIRKGRQIIDPVGQA